MSSSTSSSDLRMPHKSGADVDLDALGGGDDAASGKRGGKGARLFLASMAAGLIACTVAASLAPEDWIHTPPEYGMAQAYEDHILATCAARDTPDLVILGDSRAVAGVSLKTIANAGIKVQKFSLGGTGIHTGLAVLDRLLDCGVRPKHVVLAYGTVHVLDVGGMLLRTTNFDILKGPRASDAYATAAEWEETTIRRLAYKAISYLGTEATLVDLVLLQPALKNVLEKPPTAFANHAGNAEERASFFANGGDRYYGTANGTSELPEEKEYGPDKGVPRMNSESVAAIAALGREHGFGVSFYLLPVSETTRAKLPGKLFETIDGFLVSLESLGIRPLNRVWTVPDADFGDPSHVNSRGREDVTADFLARFTAGDLASAAGPGKTNDGIPLPAQEGQQVGQ